MSDMSTALPVQLAIRVALDNVSYSNPLPDWYTPLRIDYREREGRIRKRIESYLSGRARPQTALRIEVPRRSGELRPWMLPSVNDQIVLQACVSSLGERLASRLDPARVLSYRRNEDPNRVALTEGNLQSWFVFQDKTRKRLEAGQEPWLLQIDLRRAFPSIDRERFYRFLAGLDPQGREVELIRLLLDSFAGGAPGIPLINDSVFFLGNSYLSQVDGIVARHTGSFLRFMDDYRIFGPSRERLEEQFELIHRDLRGQGFELNLDKLKLGSAAEYLEAIDSPRFSPGDQYVSAVTGDVLDPEQVATVVIRVLQEPERYLHEGFGRFLLGVLRRFRYEGVAAETTRAPLGPAEVALRDALASTDAAALATGLLTRYGVDPRQAWRIIWLIYLMEFMETKTSPQAHALIEQIETRPDMPQVVRLWAHRGRVGRQPEQEVLPEELHELGYLDAGLRCYGDEPCTDADS
jgi:hypothetical protein